jgi:hypothetical protein
VQCPAIVIGARPPDVAARACPVKDDTSALGDGGIEASGCSAKTTRLPTGSVTVAIFTYV